MRREGRENGNSCRTGWDRKEGKLTKLGGFHVPKDWQKSHHNLNSSQKSASLWFIESCGCICSGSPGDLYFFIEVCVFHVADMRY